jgi:Major royal jelly protein
MQLTRVAASREHMINGVAVAPSGRIFASLPRWLDRPTPGVAEVLPDGSLRPFPGCGWNESASSRPVAERLVAVHSIHADPYNHLWIVDDAAPQQTRDESACPKLVDIDLETNGINRVFILDIDAAPAGAVLGHVRADRHNAYVTDSAYGAIVVIERSTGRARRILSQHPKTQADPSIMPIVDGQPFQKGDGSPIIVNANLIEITDEWLYFTCLFGPALKRIKLAKVLDPQRSDPDLGNAIEDVAPIPPCAGLMRAPDGRLYMSAFTKNAILAVRDGGVRPVITDPRISFPNEGSFGPDGWLYFPASQAHRLPLFHADRQSRVQLPWEVFKIDLSRSST